MIKQIHYKFLTYEREKILWSRECSLVISRKRAELIIKNFSIAFGLGEIKIGVINSPIILGHFNRRKMEIGLNNPIYLATVYHELAHAFKGGGGHGRNFLRSLIFVYNYHSHKAYTI